MMNHTPQQEPDCQTVLTIYRLSSGYLTIQPDGSTYASEDPADVADLVEEILVDSEPSYELTNAGRQSFEAEAVRVLVTDPEFAEPATLQRAPTPEEAREIAVENARKLATLKLDGLIDEPTYQLAIERACSPLSPEEVGEILDDTASKYMSGSLVRDVPTDDGEDFSHELC